MQHYPKISTTYIVALSFGSQQNKPCYIHNNIKNLSGVLLTHHIIQKILTIWFSIIQNTAKLIQNYIKYRQLTGGSKRKLVIYITLSRFEAFSQNIDHLPQLILSGIPTKHNFVIIHNKVANISRKIWTPRKQFSKISQILTIARTLTGLIYSCIPIYMNHEKVFNFINVRKCSASKLMLCT